MNVAFDFGITNTDVVVDYNPKKEFFTFPSKKINESFIEEIFESINIQHNEIKNIAVTGGKSSDLNDIYKNIKITKVNEVDAIGYGAIEIYNLKDEPFVVVSCGTGTACVYHNEGQFNHLGGISVGGGTLQGLSKYLVGNKNADEIEKLAVEGDRKKLDFLIGDVVNEIGSLHPEITASNFAKAKDLDDSSPEDITSSISNMVGEVIGTISYLNAMLCNESKVYFLGRSSLNAVIRTGIEDRLKLANIVGVFEDEREYGNVLGALLYLKAKLT
jgi:type II pantothenate kinase